MEQQDDFTDFFSVNFRILMNKIKNTNPTLFMNKFHAIHENSSFLQNTILNTKTLKMPNFDNDGIQFMLENGYDFTKPVINDFEGKNLNLYTAKISSIWRRNISFKEEENELYFYDQESDKRYPSSLLNDYTLELGSLHPLKQTHITEQLLISNPNFIKNLHKNEFYLLHYAFRQKNKELIELLYKHGFDSKLIDNKGKTISEYANIISLFILLSHRLN